MKKIAIIFPDPHLAYSPTTLNLHYYLSERFHVTLYALPNRQYPDVKSEGVHYLQIPFLLRKFYGGINRVSKTQGKLLLNRIMKKLLKYEFATQSFDHTIAVDPVAVWMIPPNYKGIILLLSLELTFNSNYYLNKLNWKLIQAVIIQSQDRLHYLNNNYNGTVFFLQNAPDINGHWKGRLTKTMSNNLLFLGTAKPEFGIYHCLDFLVANDNYTITIIGSIPSTVEQVISTKYQSLLLNAQLRINRKYFSGSDLLRHISDYSIGFCFYDLSYPGMDNINYQTAPSGKMFSYFAAGVPCIGNSIPGLNPIKIFNAGALIDDFAAVNIRSAIIELSANYSSKLEGCKAAALHYDFSKAVQPIIGFLNSTP